MSAGPAQGRRESKSTSGTKGRPGVFLEDDCPISEIGVECNREKAHLAPFPAPVRLHIWWARRPLTVSRAAVIGSLLPVGTDRKAFLRLCGVSGNPVQDRARIDEANRIGVTLESGYASDRAFKAKVPESSLATFRKVLKQLWGIESPMVLDSFAGGGSIPLEAYRMGCNGIANELNPVASVVERATLEYPVIFGSGFVGEIRDWGTKIEQTLEERLNAYFPKGPGETVFGYIWVRTVQCKDCELRVPLAPNWWLDTENGVGLRLSFPDRGEGNACVFHVIKKSSTFDPGKGTIAHGVALCPRCHLPLDDDYLKSEARAGRMGHQLAAVGFRHEGREGRLFRSANAQDLEGVSLAEKALSAALPDWRAKGLLPEEERYIGPADRSANYGVLQWYQMFNPRQLLVHLTTLETILGLDWGDVRDSKKKEALKVYMAMVFDKTLDWNSTGTTWHPNRAILGHTFQRHDFAFKWSYGEMDGASRLWGFGVSQVSDAYKGIVDLISPGSSAPPLILAEDARSLPMVGDRSVAAVVIDPPYYDNVIYSELSDFFYVWMRRCLRDVFPSMFSSELTDKENEAVANVARFKSAHRGKARDLAKRDYEAKMQAAFLECARVLRDDGVLTVMFTHKQVEAWDTLSAALFTSGFEVTASWPIHTESQRSLHQAKKNAAASTILLVCRKRPPHSVQAWWEDLQEDLDQEVHQHAEEYVKRGLKGQDIFIACFGPALRVVSEHWPVRSKDGQVIRPDQALDRARQVVADWFLDRIAAGKGKDVDSTTRFYVLAWHIFQAREFPFDEARKLAMSLGVDMDQMTAHKVVEKRGQGVRLLMPRDRVRLRAIHSEDKSFDWDLDYIHAAISTYEDGKGAALSRFHQRTGALQREGYRAAIGLLLDVLPRVAEVSEYKALDEMWQSSLQSQVVRRVQRTDLTGETQRRLDDLSEDESEDDADENVEES